MAIDLALFADLGVFLNFHEGADLGLLADLAPIKVDELGKSDAVSKLYLRRDALIFRHSRMILPFCSSERSAASSMRTTCNPATPSLNGFLSFRIQSIK